MPRVPPRVPGPVLIGLGALAGLKLATEFHRLTISRLHSGAVDLVLRFEELQRWFAGLPIYTGMDHITYPPATYLLLWPFLGWLPVDGVRWLWALTSAAALAWMVVLIVRATGAGPGRERWFVALMFLSMNAAGVTVGNGQLILHLLPALLTAVLLLHRPSAGWATDLGVALLLTFTLIKPSVSLPFAWVALFTSRRLRPLVLTVAMQLALTWLALRFQPGAPLELLRQWLAQNQPTLGGGYGDLQSGLVAIGLERFAMPASFGLLGLLGWWTWRNRAADPWILLGVAALVARLWAYHRVYDDVLTIVPMVALYRMARDQAPAGRRWTAEAVVLGAGIVTMLELARWETGGPPLDRVFIWSHVAVWLAMLLLLGRAARQAGSRPTPSASATRLM